MERKTRFNEPGKLQLLKGDSVKRPNKNLQKRLFFHQVDFNHQSLELENDRDKMNFIEQFLAYTDDCESPTSFFQWSAISALSTVMRDNVYLHWGQLKIYPNLYIMILADSGACRKGLPLKKMNELVSAIDNTKLIQGRSSIQGVVAELSRDESGSKGFIQKKGACGLLYAEEFAASLVNDPAVIHILTDLYEFRETYPVILRDSVTILKNVCLGMLVATNTTMLQEIYNNSATEGGLIGRTIIIHEKKRRKRNSMVFSEKKTEADKVPLLNHLRALSKIHGEVETEMPAKIYYDDWYNAIDDDTEDKTGFIHRVHVGVAKVALALAAAEEEILTTGKIVIRLPHMVEAVRLTWKIKENQQAITMGQGRSSNAVQMSIFLKALAGAKGYQLTRRDLLKRHWSDFDNPTLEVIVTTMENAGLIKTTSILNETGYQLTERALKEVLNHEIEQKKIKIVG